MIAGFMGCGKTAVAGALAVHLNCKMIDLDEAITEREGRSPARIIEEDGESAFRAIETITLHDVLKDGSVGVIALGGGAWITGTTKEQAQELYERRRPVYALADLRLEADEAVSLDDLALKIEDQVAHPGLP